MKESTARIGDGHDDDRTVSECFPCRWPEINKISKILKVIYIYTHTYMCIKTRRIKTEEDAKWPKVKYPNKRER